MFFKYKDVNIAYEFFPNMTAGVKTLVIIHGWGGPQAWNNYIEQFARKDFQVILIHLPGFGESTLPKNYKKLDSYKYAEYIANLLKDIGLEDSILMGHSLGGKIATILNTKYKIGSRLILVDCACFHRLYPMWWLKTQLVKLGKAILKRLGAFGQKILNSQRLLKLFASQDYYNASYELRHVLKNVVDNDVRRLLPKINVDTLVIWGEKDDITPLIDGVCTNKLVKKSRLKIIKDAKHFPFILRPNIFHNLVTNFTHEI